MGYLASLNDYIVSRLCRRLHILASQNSRRIFFYINERAYSLFFRLTNYGKKN